ncbi:TetR family transcriptional regulator [Janibacter sp. DB-40]|uniref:TetR/AcrR family transcriptional regulator n=1 Tax=Janibacter sp. DB-40 TaxID=3028808 RepID=UPI002406AD93|nr:TetR family transcriptional regulator [Janibacter sp. DB-40]
MSARGRRSGGADTRAEILDVARGLFAAKGYDGTSVRGVAREAGVDPALVHHYFDGKPGLFSEVVGVPAGIEEQITAAVAGPHEGAGERVVRTFLRVWDGPEGRDRFRALVGAVASHEEAAHLLRDFVSRSILRSLAHIFGDEDVLPDLAVAAVGAQLVGMALLRYLLEVPPMADADPEEIVAVLAPPIQALLVP